MEYKNTLNLPRTDFAMKANLATSEPLRLQSWLANRLYETLQNQRKAAPRFVLHDGPPFANGNVHIGNALNKILKDFIIKYQSLRGKCAPYVPGWDCHGLPIEFKVGQELRKKSAHDDSPMDAPTIRKACDEYARKYIDIQREQFQRLGVLGDWDLPYLTLDPAYEAAELHLFADLVEQGFVYRGKKPVYWSIPCRTALAEAEVEYQEHVSQSVFVKFPVIDYPGTFIIIWTTTPWTLPANLAIAYHPEFNYTLVHAMDGSYIVSVSMLSELSDKFGWEGYQIIRSLYGENLAGLKCQHPFIDREVPLLADESFIDICTGSGFVHIAPGHGMEDYHLGRKNGLEIYSPIDDNGCFCHTADFPAEKQMPAALIGKSVLEKDGQCEANAAVLAILRDNNMLLHQEDYVHSYPHCWRSKTPVIFRAMDQWFIQLDHGGFRDKAVDTIEHIEWTPDWGKARIDAAVRSRPDWCISRQRVWGVPIPAFFDAQGSPILDAGVVRAAADLIEKHGSNIWFEKDAAELWQLLKPAEWQGAEPVAKSNDTLDVWIDSGSSSRAVLMRRPELHHHGVPGELPGASWQSDVYLEGSDQHRGWFQSSLLLSLAGNGSAPFKKVITHGFMVDADREKISKSKQGQADYEKPQTAEAYVKKFGADVLRLWVASQDFRNDIVVSDERIEKVGEIYRMIRNALRFQLSNLYDFDPTRHPVSDVQLDVLDRWILAEFSELERAVEAAYETFEFHLIYQQLSQFIAVELSAVYHDIIKDALYTLEANSPRRRAIQTALFRMVKSLCQMLSPVLVFTADEAWEFLPGNVAGSSVHLACWKPSDGNFYLSEQVVWEQQFGIRERVLQELEKARQSKLIGKSLEAKVLLKGPADQMPDGEHISSLKTLLNISQLEIEPENSSEMQIIISHAEGQKCERCWHWDTSVGTSTEHPGLCQACYEIVRSICVS